MVQGSAQAIEAGPDAGGPGGGGAIIRIVPEGIVSWSLVPPKGERDDRPR